MTNKEFLIEVQKSCHIEMSQCELLLANLQKVMAKAGVDQVPVVLSGLGVFTSHKHPEYVQEDKQTGALTLYPPRISYRMQSEMNDDAIAVEVLLAEYTKISNDVTKEFIDALVSKINDSLQAGLDIDVDVPGLGSFSVVKTHNSELQHVSYVPTEQMKELVNAPFNCFEPVVIGEAEKVIAEEIVLAKETEESTAEAVDELPTEQVDVLPTDEVNELPARQVDEMSAEAVDESSVAEEEEPVVEEPVKEEPLVTMASDIPEAKPAAEAKDIKIAEDPNEDSSYNRLLYISLSVIMLTCGFLVWLMFGGDLPSWENEPVDTVVVDAVNDDNISDVIEHNVDTIAVAEKPSEPIAEQKVEKPIESKPEQNEEKVVERPVEKTGSEFHRMKGADGKLVTVSLEPGERLTILALKHFGDKAFWPYIFDANADKLKAPNLVQAGMTLYLPDPTYYNIDANDPESLRKAKNRGAQLLK